MMFDYYGQMLHELNKYNLIVGVEMPTMKELKFEIPYMLQPSTCQTLAGRYKARVVAGKRPVYTPSVTRLICDSAVETQGHLQSRLERVKADIHTVLTEQILYVLRRFSPKVVRPDVKETRTSTPSMYRVEKYHSFGHSSKRLRKRRFISQLIGLGIQGIGAYLDYRKTSRFEKGLEHLMKYNAFQDKEIRAIRKDMMSLTEATLRDLKDLKYDVRHHGEMINRLTKEVNAMIPKINDFEVFF